MRFLLTLLLTAVASAPLRADEAPTARTPKEGLQPLHALVGSWRVTGELLQGTTQERRQGSWLEKVSWEWRFKGDDAWLVGTVHGGRHYASCEIRYLPDVDRYRLTLGTTSKERVVFEGSLGQRRLVVETAGTKGPSQRLTLHLLHANRYLCRFEERPAGKTVYRQLYRVGATKEGVPFASAESQPECIVSGGLGTSTVMYKGKTYYVCCSGCRDAFNEEPEKFIKEFEAKKKEQAGK